MTQVIAVGLGNMGGAIASRIHGGGFAVRGIDQDENRRAQWGSDNGAGTSASLRDVDWTGVERLIVATRTTAQAAEVLAEAAALAVGPVTCHVTTTLEPGFARDLARLGTETLHVLEQPVSGGADAARAGGLTILSAGPLDPASRAFLTGTIAARVVEFEHYGEPTLVKLINNAVAAYNTRAMALMMVLAERLGLDPARVKEVIGTSSGASMMGSMIDRLGDDQAALLVKDAHLLMAVAPTLPAVTIDTGSSLIEDVRRCRDILGRAG